MAVGIAQRIIREGVSDQIAFNIMDLKDPKEMWDKLKSICTEVGQGVVYSILQELLHYPKITKPKGYEKPVMQIFAEVRYLCKRLRKAMTPGRDLWDTIAIVIVLDSLHDASIRPLPLYWKRATKQSTRFRAFCSLKKPRTLANESLEI